MPKVNTTKPHPMTRLLKGYDISGAVLASALGCSYPTAKSKLDNPTKITLGDIVKIHRKFGIPVEEIREAVI